MQVCIHLKHQFRIFSKYPKLVCDIEISFEVLLNEVPTYYTNYL